MKPLSTLLLAALFQSISPSTAPVITRHYQPREHLAYTMHAINQDRRRTLVYDASAQATVAFDPAGVPVETFTWTSLTHDGVPTPLTEQTQHFRQPLSLAPEYKLSIPNLAQVQPTLIGPITDLLTFYADVQLAMRQRTLQHPGDHVLIPHPKPNSWADGTYVTLGQDAVDFDITLKQLDPTADRAVLLVRHVPPVQLGVSLPADWMQAPIAQAANNWVQVSSDGSGHFIAGVGAETFTATIELALSSGRILNVNMDNPVQVLERTCEDSDLTRCDAPIRSTIRRQITLKASPIPL